ncbi:MFS transporter [Streptomyces sp. CMB-StM0423]|uniref:MFS transporter n=1 Tax=Streptomyces sp. CMB-StM0423 TaxID=2059884 RepID=UPI0018FE0DE8|nr:MFS transporter [Streptomyces sp. CMB-StM0423]
MIHELSPQTVVANNVAYDLLPQARSRISTVYGTAMFLGGAIGSAIGSLAYDHFGWTGATTTAATLSIGGLLGTLGTRRPEKQHLPRQQNAVRTGVRSRFGCAATDSFVSPWLSAQVRRSLGGGAHGR